MFFTGLLQSIMGSLILSKTVVVLAYEEISFICNFTELFFNLFCRGKKECFCGKECKVVEVWEIFQLSQSPCLYNISSLKIKI